MGSAAPRDFETLRDLVVAGAPNLPKRLAQAAGYALSRPDEIALGTAASIAEAAGVQPSTLVRLARHLGYEGFSDLQGVFRDRLKSRASSYEERLKKLESGIAGDSHEEALLNGFIVSARRSLDDLAQSIDHSDFGRSVGVLAGADTVYLVARRRSFPLVSHMAYAFGKLKIRHVLLGSPNGIDEEIADAATPADAAIACSFAPYASATVELARRVSAQGAPVVSITDSAMSPLAPLSACVLRVAENDFAGFRSISAGMALAMALPVAVAERRRYAR